MTAEQFAAMITALAAMLTALAAIYAQVRQTHALVNSRMTELLDLTRKASHAEGELAEKRNV